MLMKKIFLSAVFYGLAPLAHLSAQTFTLNNYSDTNINWSSAEIWSVSGEGSQTFPQDGGNVVLSNESQSVNQTLVVDDSYKIDSLNVSMNGDGAHWSFSVNAGKTLEIAEDSVVDASFNWYQLMICGAGSYDFKKNLTLNGDIGGGKRATISFGNSSSSRQLSSLNVGGNLNITNDSAVDMNVYFNVAEVNIAGALNIAPKSKVVLARSTNSANGAVSSFSLGGINGSGALRLGFDSASYYGRKSVANVTISGEGGSWSVTFDKMTTNADSRFNLTMDGRGTQDFKVSSATFVDGATNSNIIDTLTVNNGVFNYGAGDYVSGSLVLNGGKFSAASLIDSGIDEDVGAARFESGLLNGGAIMFDIWTAGATFDKIEFSGLFDKGDGDMSLEFRFDAEGMAELVEMGLSAFEDMIVYASGSSIEGTVLNGVSNGFAWEAVFGETGMDVTFAAIPEPAVIAALFGLSALLFAAFRGERKRGGRA